MDVRLLEATDDPERVVCTAARCDYSSAYVGDQSFEETMSTVEGDISRREETHPDRPPPLARPLRPVRTPTGHLRGRGDQPVVYGSAHPPPPRLLRRAIHALRRLRRGRPERGSGGRDGRDAARRHGRLVGWPEPTTHRHRRGDHRPPPRGVPRVRDPVGRVLSGTPRPGDGSRGRRDSCSRSERRSTSCSRSTRGC